MKKFLVGLAMFLFLLMPMIALPALAEDSGVDTLLWGEQKELVGDELGLGEEDPRVIIASVIRVVLGFLGIIAVIIIILGGFKWMTAAGNEDKIDEAKKLITAGVIGLVIILASWGIATFVMKAIYTATDAQG
jgi:hypothetical protein